MTRRTNWDYYRSMFIFKVEDGTVVYSKDDIIENLEKLTNIAGIGVTAFKMPYKDMENVWRIVTRGNSFRYALLDYGFVLNAIERRYGTIIKRRIQGRRWKRNIDWYESLTQDEIRKVAQKNAKTGEVFRGGGYELEDFEEHNKYNRDGEQIG